jgi:WD40 repeat protein
MRNFSGHNTSINALALNEDGVLVSCGDDGSLQFWDADSGYCFQKTKTIAQPGKPPESYRCSFTCSLLINVLSNLQAH